MVTVVWLLRRSTCFKYFEIQELWLTVLMNLLSQSNIFSNRNSKICSKTNLLSTCGKNGNFQNFYFMIFSTLEHIFTHISFSVVSIVITIHFLTFLVDEVVGLDDSSEKGMIVTFFCITGLLVTRWIYSGHSPLSDLYESLIFLSWGFSLIHMVSYFKKRKYKYCFILDNYCNIVCSYYIKKKVKTSMFFIMGDSLF